MQDNGQFTAIHQAMLQQMLEWRYPMDFHRPPPLWDAHIVAHAHGKFAMLYYRESMSHSWRSTSYLRAGAPEPTGARGQAVLRRKCCFDAGSTVGAVEYAVTVGYSAG